MADKKISQLTSASTPLAGTEVLPIVQSASTVKVSVANLTAGRTVGATNVLLDASGTLYGANTSGSFYSAITPYDGSGNMAFVTAYAGGTMTFTTGGGLRWTIDNTGNLIQGTAAKGVNFTANTPAAGMTSQLLNWYEEGTWTPTRNGFTEVLGGGSITTTGTYTRVGRLVTVIASIIPAGGATIAASSGIGSYLSGLPFTVATPCPGAWVDSISVADNGGLLANATQLYVTTAWAASSNIKRFSATYFV
jgi:hypothetical protein